MNILVIEDNSIAAAYLKYKLQRLQGVFPDVQVELALSMKAAENILKTFKPNIITLDLTLKGHEDSEFVKSRLPWLASIAPVVIITCAELDFYSTKQLIELGATAVLDKDLMSSESFMNQLLAICVKVETRPAECV